ncbi:MAG TPA: hypothetical protein VG222_05395 [Vicinamibacterales bacterium]|nr:hypothetical protein [Vicinamibacterales bacterium]
MTLVESTPSPPASDTLPATAGAALIAYILVSVGSSLHGDILLLLGLPLTMAGFLVACLTATRGAGGRAGLPLAKAAMLLSAMAAVGVVATGVDNTRPWFNLATRAYFALAIVLVGVFAGSGAAGRRRTTSALVIGAIALQVAAPLGVQIRVDLWSWTQTATLALLHGVHPYTVHAPDLQRGGFDFGSTPTLYPYMPLTLLAAAPWVAWLGDYRFGVACCLPITVALLRKAGRALEVETPFVDLLTLALVLHPLGTAMTATGYMEPLLVMTAAVFFLFAVTAPRGVGEATAFLLLPALKQYVAAPVLLYLAMRGRARSVAIGLVVAAATVAPLVWWQWRSTLAGMFFFVRVPLRFRTDSDSIAALLVAMTGIEAPRSLAVLTEFVVAGVAYWRLRDRGLEGLLLASALSLLASFLVAPQAFTNYYYFAGALLLLSSLAAAQRPRPA